MRNAKNLNGIKKPQYIGKLVSVPIRITEMAEIEVRLTDDRLQNVIPGAKVRDRADFMMPLVGIVGDAAVDTIVTAAHECRELMLTAEVATADGPYVLIYLDARPIRSCLELIGAESIEVEMAVKMAANAAAGRGILTYIRERIVEILDIRHLDGLPVLRRALDAVILQSASSGKIKGKPARIHILQIGPPAVGKGMIHRAAQVVSPIVQRVSTTRVSPLGLTGSKSRIDGNRSRIIPGQLLLAGAGTVLMEDLQNVDTVTRRHFFGILSEVMEDGRALRSTHDALDAEVDAAVLGDLNPKSTVRPAHSSNKDVIFLDDLDLPQSFLSRVDLAFVYTRDIVRQLEVMKEITKSITHVGPEEELRKDPRARELQVLLAHLRDALPVIDLEGIAPLVNEKHEELMNANWDKLQALDLASDHLARGARSVMKLAAASARINQRAKANEDDVRAAFELYSEKVRFISLCEPALRPVNSWVGSRGAKERRQSAIADHFGGFGPVHIREVMAMFPEVKSKKTIERDLRAVGAEPDGRGYWLVPVARPGGSDVGAASAPQSLSSRPSERRRKGDLVPKQARRLLSI